MKGINTIRFEATNLEQGVYICRMLVNGEERIVKRMEIIR
jgi:hypothetical protein